MFSVLTLPISLLFCLSLSPYPGFSVLASLLGRLWGIMKEMDGDGWKEMDGSKLFIFFLQLWQKKRFRQYLVTLILEN